MESYQSLVARASVNAAKAHPALADASVRVEEDSDGLVLHAVYTMTGTANPVTVMALVEDRLIPDMEKLLDASFVQRHVRFAVEAAADTHHADHRSGSQPALATA